VTSLVRLFARRGNRAANTSTRLASSLLLTLLLALSAAVTLPASAGAVVKTVSATTVGLQPRVESSVLDGLQGLNEKNELFSVTTPESFGNPAGNPVLHGTDVYVIYWDPTYRYHNDWKEKIDEFTQRTGTASGSVSDVFAVDTQYTDKTNAPASTQLTFRGAYSDTSPYPAAGCVDPAPLEEYKPFKTGPISCLTDQQIHQQLESFIGTHNLVKGMHSVFYVLTPPGVTVCLDGGGAGGHCSDFSASVKETEEEKFESASYKNSFCSYHADVNPGALETGDASTILYGVIPWSAGGVGDGQFARADQVEAPYCQDGGFNPTTNPIEKREGVLSEEEKKKFEEMKEEEKKKFIEEGLNRPHVQEPNQPQQCPSPDGFCDTGLADLIINQIAIEQQGIVTNPLLHSWQDSTGNEVTDECRNFFAPAAGNAAANPGSGAGTLHNQSIAEGSYYLNEAFNAASLHLSYPAVPCIPGVRLEPKFTAPNPVNTGDVVAFDGSESDISLDAGVGYDAKGAPQPNYATYTWNFGDGSPNVSGYAPGSPPCEPPWSTACAESVFHSYPAAGTYNVTLTVRDVGGNTASVTHGVTVSGPPPGGSSGSGSGSAGPGSSGSSGSSTSPGSNSGTQGSALPAPVVTTAIASHSLANVLSKGLPVRYRVNEQVAGHFEVLLSRKLAKRLKIGGPPALGLPPGAEPEVVIGKALLVTLKGGASMVRIHFSKKTAARLHRLKQVSLGLRLVVRNAASSNPATTTVVSVFTLKH
jgi:hypothetical protein